MQKYILNKAEILKFFLLFYSVIRIFSWHKVHKYLLEIMYVVMTFAKVLAIFLEVK